MAPNTNIKSYLQQQHAVAAAAAGAVILTAPRVRQSGHHAIVSEQQVSLPASGGSAPATEIVRSYDEIDQIYDYIRGLAPLPDNLRRMKSIDFEHIELRERQKRAHQQQQLQKLQLEQRQKLIAEQQQQQQKRFLSNVAGDQAPPTGRRSAKLRQREEAAQVTGSEQLAPPPPTGAAANANSLPPVALRVTASEARRPIVKRVESFNLKKPLGEQRSILLSQQNQPIFRLPRAQSTSSLGKHQRQQPNNQKPSINGGATKQQRSQLARPLDSILCSDLVESFVDDDEGEVRPLNELTSSSASSSSTSKSNSSSATTSSSSNEKASSSTSNESEETRSSTSSSSRTSSESHNSRKQLERNEEHIYEQIPAQNQANDLHHLIAKRAIEAQENVRPHRVETRPSAKLLGPANKINYPVAYSANVAANARYQQQVATLFACQQQQLLRNNLQKTRKPISSQFVAPRQQQQQQPPPLSSMPRSLAKVAHHQRLSMGNLHLLTSAAGTIPMASLWNPRKQQASSSSRKLDRLAARPLELAPAELIGQIQMPRAVSKRQVGPPPQVTYGSQGNERKWRRPSDLVAASTLTANSRHLWQTELPPGPVRASIKESVAGPVLSRPNNLIAIGETQRAARLARKRASGRRLTAIGIEQSWEGLQQPNLTYDLRKHQEQRQAARANFFAAEPKMRVAAAAGIASDTRAPLIDAEEEEEQEEEEGLKCESNRVSSLKQQTTSPAPARCLVNSISDLHSFSSPPSSSSSATSPSISGDDEELRKMNETTRTTPELSQSCDSTQSDQSETTPRKSDCHHHLKPPVKAHLKQCCAEVARQADNKISQPAAAAKAKRLGSKLFSNGERLLSLIGLDTIGSSGGGSGNLESGGDKMAAGTNQVGTMRSSSDKQQRRQLPKLSLRRTSAPPTPPQQVGGQSASSGRRFSSSGVESLGAKQQTIQTSSGNALSRAAPRPSLVSHFEHPIVEIAKVATKQQQQQASKSSRHQKAAAAAAELQETGSSGTTNSTSSYEAAIKNSAARRAVAPLSDENPRTRSKRPSVASSTTSNGQSQQQHSTLIRVPKLSKQSHLLNRPLPKVPAVSAASTSGRQHLSSSLLYQQRLPASQANATLTRTQRHLAAASVRPQQATNAPPERYGTSRSSEPSSSAAAQSRAAQRYLLDQQQLARAHIKQHRSPLSTNLDASEPPATSGSHQHQSSVRVRRTSQNRLSSLGASIQPSPTVTTYTSSGISSTHLATNASSSSSSQRSKASATSKSASSNGPGAQVKAVAPRTTSGSSNTLEGASSWRNQSGEDRSDDDDEQFEMIDQRGAVSNSTSPDIMRFNLSDEKGDNLAAQRSHLKSFDERFSNKYADQHLASSDDSLLESINFSGTLESRSRRRKGATSSARNQ